MTQPKLLAFHSDAKLKEDMVAEIKWHQVKLHPDGLAIIDTVDRELVERYKWYRSPDGYAVRYFYTKNRDGSWKHHTERMHRLITNPSANEDVDHKNHRKLDNRRDNLRACSRALNVANTNSRKGSTSRFKGVSFCKQTGKWRATIKSGGLQKSLGRHAIEVKAAEAYDSAAKLAFGSFATLNLSKAE